MAKTSKKRFKIALALIIVTILVLASIFTYYVLNEKEKEEATEEEDVFVLDDRISPYTNQGLFVEILRIRNRGLMDKMLSYGTSWKNPPNFYYNIEVDGKKGITKGFVGEDGLYNTWDTINKESLLIFYIEEEQEKSDVTIEIVEVVKSGLFKRKTTDVIKEKISFVYDYYTGHWYGDDSLIDSDGCGHYLGDEYEVWFNVYQADYDHDGIPYWAEVNILGTDPTVDDRDLDPDEDGIPTSWEWKWGYDPFVWNDHMNLDPDVDGIENVEEYQMRKYFSNPYQPDIYIETDGMEKKGLIDTKHIFFKESQQMVIERFAQHGINVYIDDGWPDGPKNGGGEELPFIGAADDTQSRQNLMFYKHNFPDERKGIFRYLVVGYENGGFIIPADYNKLDCIYVGNNIAARITRLAFTPRVNRVMIAKNALHELGHSIGLVPVTFKGNDIQTRRITDRYPNMSDEEYDKFVKNYYSIMNYYYIYNKPFYFSDETHTYLFDYSDGSNGEPYDQNDWEYIYLPTFQLDAVSYEEPEETVDFTFEDFEVSDEYPGVVLDGWEFDENLTVKYSEKFTTLATVKNTDYEIQIYVKTERDEEGEKNIRIYAKPNVEPVHVRWTLIAEGKLDYEENIQLYSQQSEIDFAMSQR